jgi:hypothetical protein
VAFPKWAIRARAIPESSFSPGENSDIASMGKIMARQLTLDFIASAAASSWAGLI